MHVKNFIFLWHKWGQSGYNNIGQNRAKFVAMPKSKIGKFFGRMWTGVMYTYRWREFMK